MEIRTHGASDLRQIWTRLASLSGIKRIVIASGMTFFFVCYFTLLNLKFFPATEMPITAADRWVSFSAQAIWPYASLWIYVNLVPALIDDRREMLSYYLSAGAICAVGFSVFFFWPTTTPAADIDWSHHPLYQHLKTVDRGGNALPSLHACFAIFSALWLDRMLRAMRVNAGWRIFNALWCAGILYSTLATRQHVAIDVYAGLILGLAGYALQMAIARWLRKPAPLAANAEIIS